MAFELTPPSPSPQEAKPQPPPKRKRKSFEESTEESKEEVFAKSSEIPPQTVIRRPVRAQKKSRVSKVSKKVIGPEGGEESVKKRALVAAIHAHKDSPDFAILVQCFAALLEQKIVPEDPALLSYLLDRLNKTDEPTRSLEQVIKLHHIFVAILRDAEEPEMRQKLSNWIFLTSTQETIFDDIALFASQFPHALADLFRKFEDMSGISISSETDHLLADITKRQSSNVDETKWILARLQQALSERAFQVTFDSGSGKNVLSVEQFLQMPVPPTLEERVQMRFLQLSRAFETAPIEEIHSKLSLDEIKALALFIEKSVCPVKELSERYFLAGEGQLVRDLHVDWKAREIYVIAHPLSSQLKAKGVSKRALSAVAISFEPTLSAEKVAQISPVPPVPGKKFDLAEITKELPFYQRLQGVPGVMRLRSFTHLTTTLQGASAPQKSVSLIFNLANKGDLRTVLQKRELTLSRSLHIKRQIIHTGAEFEKRKLFHGDLKPANILIDDEDKCFTTDFGMSHFIGEAEPCWTLGHNFYGAWWFTPPELLHRNPYLPSFKSDPLTTAEAYAKVESWVTGWILYEMEFGRPWWVSQLMLKKESFPPPLTYEEKRALTRDYTSKVECVTKEISVIPEAFRTERQHFTWAMCNLIQIDPEKRWTRTQAHAYLQQHPAP